MSPSDAGLDRTTPVPNALLDSFLPVLSDTELRVLLVVDRATLGWKEGKGRKYSDWLSHRQLQARTGRAGASVSHAVQSLVRRGLLVVEDGAGRVRDSAHSRRAARARLYYRLGDALLQPGLNQITLTSGSLKNEVEAQEKANQTPSSSPLPVQKVKTTKETGTKETGTKEKENKMSSSKCEVSSVLPISEVTEADASSLEAASQNPLEEQVELFIRAFTQAYRLARLSQAVPPVEAADRALLREYLKHPGLDVLEAWVPAFFNASFGYARRRGWSLGCYLNCLFILQAQAGSKAGTKTRGGSGWKRAGAEKSSE